MSGCLHLTRTWKELGNPQLTRETGTSPEQRGQPGTAPLAPRAGWGQAGALPGASPRRRTSSHVKEQNQSQRAGNKRQHRARTELGTPGDGSHRPASNPRRKHTSTHYFKELIQLRAPESPCRGEATRCVSPLRHGAGSAGKGAADNSDAQQDLTFIIEK